jgi:prepilin-type N-terminal cleavage/methylation domain-containing protein
MKKGFSLVEVAIVLLVLGLMAVIVFRGGILIHSSEVRAEVGKINKNATSVSIYYSELYAIPGYNKTDSPSTLPATLGLIDIEDMIDQQFITESDLESNFSPNKWEYYHGITPDNGTTFTDDNRTYMVDTNIRTIGLSLKQVEVRFLCSFERMVDDYNFLNGTGRYFTGGMPTNPRYAPAAFVADDSLFDKCYKIKQDGVSERDDRYVFLIFAY